MGLYVRNLSGRVQALSHIYSIQIQLLRGVIIGGLSRARRGGSRSYGTPISILERCGLGGGPTPRPATDFVPNEDIR